MHFVYNQTKGAILINNLKGKFIDKSDGSRHYMLSNPVFCSKMKGFFGPADRGMSAINYFADTL